MIHSFTSIDTFHNVCPRQFYERFVAKSVPFVDTPELIKGRQDHKSLQVRLQDDVALPAHLAACEPICAAIEARGIPFVEKRFGVDRNLAETGFFDGDVWLRGSLDVQLMAKGYEGAFIVDWKTGKNREAGKEPLQQMIYAGATFAEYPECETISAVNVYTGSGQMGTAHSWKRSELPTIWRTIVPLVQEIEILLPQGAAAFKEEPSGLCGWCDVLTCQHNRKRS